MFLCRKSVSASELNELLLAMTSGHLQSVINGLQLAITSDPLMLLSCSVYANLLFILKEHRFVNANSASLRFICIAIVRFDAERRNKRRTSSSDRLFYSCFPTDDLEIWHKIRSRISQKVQKKYICMYQKERFQIACSFGVGDYFLAAVARLF